MNYSVNNNRDSIGNEGESYLSANTNNGINNSSTDKEDTNLDNNSNNSSNSGSSTKGHYLVAKLLGVKCTHDDCKCVIQKRGNMLWIPHRKQIGKHWDNLCYEGIAKPNATEVSNELRSNQIALHERIKYNKAEADVLIEQEFPSTTNSMKTHHFCNKCGFNNNRRDKFLKHFSDKKNQYNCTLALHSSRGNVIINEDTGMSIPQLILQQIKDGKFELPYDTPPINNNIPSQQQQPTSPLATTLVVPTLPTTPLPTQPLPQSIFEACESFHHYSF